MGNEISSAEGKVGFKVGATWDTALAVDTPLRVSNYTPDTSRAVLGTLGHDSRKRRKAKLGVEQTNISIAGPQVFGGGWLKLFALMCGTSGAPTEQTVGQGDYRHIIDISDFNTKFVTLAHLAESDVVEEVNSALLTQFTLTGQDNQVGSWSAQGIGSRLNNTTPINTPAGLNALVYTQAEEDVVPCGANTYFRIGNYSTGTPLGAGNNLKVKSYTFTLSKPVSTRYAGWSPGCHRTLQPKDSGIVMVQLSVTLESVDDSTIDLLNKYNNETELMAEMFVDGAQIGTGVNTSLKLQIPALKALQPGQRGYTGQATIANPTLNMEGFVAAAAPSGMTGVTYPRLTTIDRITGAYV